MTVTKQIIAISSAVTTVIGLMYVLIGIFVAVRTSEKYTDKSVSTAIEAYDSTVTRINQAQYDSIKSGINDIKNLMNNSHNE